MLHPSLLSSLEKIKPNIMKEMRNHRQGQGKLGVAEAPKQNDVCLPNIEVIKMDH